MELTKEDIARRFGKDSHAYAVSQGHAFGADLAIVVEFLQPGKTMKVLDVATGAGHTAAAVAPYVHSVLATDLAAGMVEETRKQLAAKSLANASAEVMDVEELRYESGSFDAVTCRIAPHHFLDIRKAVHEIARVLKRGGVFVLEDSVAPANRTLNRFINTLEKMRDPTHVCSYTAAQWSEFLFTEGLVPERKMRYHKQHDVADWIARGPIDDAQKAAVYRYFADAPSTARQHFKIKYKNRRATFYTDQKLILRTVKR